MKDYFKYRFSNDFDFNIDEGNFVTILGNNNDLIINTLLYENKKCNIFVDDIELNNNSKMVVRKKITFVLYKHLNIFMGETVCDEVVYPLESLAYPKNRIREILESKSKLFKIEDILERDPNSLGISDKIKIKFLSSLIIDPKIIIIDNIINMLDYSDKLLIFKILEEFKKNGGIVINFTNDVEESVFSDRIIIIYDKKIICDGSVLSVLNEEKILKRLGIGLPFNIELSKYLMDYGVINKYYLTDEKLVNAIWK